MPLNLAAFLFALFAYTNKAIYVRGINPSAS